VYVLAHELLIFRRGRKSLVLSLLCMTWLVSAPVFKYVFGGFHFNGPRENPGEILSRFRSCSGSNAKGLLAVGVRSTGKGC